jgi:hypothetical protein
MNKENQTRDDERDNTPEKGIIFDFFELFEI